MAENPTDMEALLSDVDALRDRFPKTADLYREACALMFYRYSITPTTSALYQLVRKGSMSVPSEAVRQFWNDLRRQTRVDVDNAGLPAELRASAGKLLGQVWSSARQAAEESVTHLKDGLSAERDALVTSKAQLDAQIAVLETKLGNANSAIATRDDDLVRLREQLSAAHATVQNVESKLAEARYEIERLQQEVHTTSRDHADAIDKVTTRVVQAEQRYVELEKRTLVELDRERTTMAKLQKSLESERHVASAKYEKLQADARTAQIGIARQEQALATLRTEVETLKGERDSAIARAEASREATVDLASQLAAEQARVEELRQQVRLFSERAMSDRQSKQPRSTPRKRGSKPGTHG